MVTAVGFGVCDADAAGSSTSAVMASASSADRRFPGLGSSFLVACCNRNSTPVGPTAYGQTASVINGPSPGGYPPVS